MSGYFQTKKTYKGIDTSVLRLSDPDRPKNDKATILGDTVQILRDLTAEVKRLKSEQKSLVEESCDVSSTSFFFLWLKIFLKLTQEKNELREEKAALKKDIDQLQSQFQQCIQTMFSWTAMDLTIIMGAPSFPYSMPILHPGSTVAPDSHSTAPQGHMQTPIMASPFIHVPVPPGTIPMHPSLHAYPFFGNRNNDGCNPYLTFLPYPSLVNSHSHIERPSAQYPSPIQPLPGYLVQLQHSQGNRPGAARPSGTTVISQSVGTPISAQNPSEALECQQGNISKSSDVPLVNNVQESSPTQSGCRSDYPEIMCTDLQLKTPVLFPTSPECQSNQATQACEEQGQIQEACSEVKTVKSLASSEVKKGKGLPCHRSVSVNLTFGHKASSRQPSPSQSFKDASSSSHENECSMKSNRTWAQPAEIEYGHESSDSTNLMTSTVKFVKVMHVSHPEACDRTGSTYRGTSGEGTLIFHLKRASMASRSLGHTVSSRVGAGRSGGKVGRGAGGDRQGEEASGEEDGAQAGRESHAAVVGLSINRGQAGVNVVDGKWGDRTQGGGGYTSNSTRIDTKAMGEDSNEVDLSSKNQS
eukprot:Gb_40349 [translate_table: standard]